MKRISYVIRSVTSEVDPTNVFRSEVDNGGCSEDVVVEDVDVVDMRQFQRHQHFHY